MFKLALIALMGSFAFASTAAAQAKRCAYPTLQSMAKSWVGGTLGEYYFLDIADDGTGVLAMQWAQDKPAKAYRISRTRLTERRADFTLQALDESSESLYMRGDVCPGSIEIRIGSRAPKWQLDAVLLPYHDEAARLKAVMERANAVRKNQ
jgi:hypothetical protein